MASKFIQQKFTQEFNTLNINNDGFLSKADFERVATNMISALNLSADSLKSQIILARYMLWWQGATVRDADGDGRVSLDEWLAYDLQVTTSPEAFQMILQAGADELFKILDSDGDGSISCAEYKIWLGCYGVNDAAAEIAFQHLDVSKTGQVSHAEMHARVHEFYLSEDPSASGNWLFGAL